MNPDILYIHADDYEDDKIYKRGDYFDFGIVRGKYFLEYFKSIIVLNFIFLSVASSCNTNLNFV